MVKDHFLLPINSKGSFICASQICHPFSSELDTTSITRVFVLPLSGDKFTFPGLMTSDGGYAFVQDYFRRQDQRGCNVTLSHNALV